ncbi:hypothetical protein TKK_0016790 [Trichogramma kaykai]
MAGPRPASLPFCTVTVTLSDIMFAGGLSGDSESFSNMTRYTLIKWHSVEAPTCRITDRLSSLSSSANTRDEHQLLM